MTTTHKNTIRFTDSVNFEPVVTDEVKDYYSNPSNSLQPLRIKIAATHAGKITRNHGFYLPHRMKTGAATFTAQYPKPIQVHHDSQKDPVGRVIAAQYVDTSRGIMDSWDGRKLMDELRPISDSLLQSFCDGKLSRREMYDIADRYFIQDNNIVDDPDYQGLGYIELIAEISDPEAIKKVLDKRYLTGSVGASTDSAVCSVCKNDWAGEDGPCEHKPGKVYDSKKCVLIAGDLKYDEWSFVNAPADSHAAVIELNTTGVHDSVHVDVEMTRPSDKVAFEILDHTNGGNEMATTEDSQVTAVQMKTDEVHGHKHVVFADADGDGHTDFVSWKHPDEPEETQAVQHKHMVSSWDVKEEMKHAHKIINPLKKQKDETVTEEPKTEDAKVEEPKVEEVTKTEDAVVEAPKVEEVIVPQDMKVEEPVVTEPPTEQDPLRLHFGDQYDEIVGVDSWGKQNAAMVMLGDKGEVLHEDGSKIEIADKKLKADDRKKMAGSTFCGPDRSYPVNDCGHAKSAMAYAKKYNAGSGVQACIRRKASRLGCPFSGEAKDSVDTSASQYEAGHFDTYEDQELLDMMGALKEAMKERQLICPCEEHVEETNQKERLDALQKEIKYQLEDIDSLHNQLAESYKVTRQLKLQNICNFKKLAGEVTDFTKVSDSLKDSSSDDMDKILKDLNEKVDIDKITDKINSGLSNNPQGTVENPVITEKIETPKRDVNLNRATLERIRDEYYSLCLSRGEIVAEQYLADLKKRGILPNGEMMDVKKS